MRQAVAGRWRGLGVHVGQPGQTQVDPGQLRDLGSKVDQVAEAVSHAYTKHAGNLNPHGGEGWQCVTTAQAATQRWSGFITQLAASVRKVGDDLQQAAQAYATSDQHAATSLQQAGKLK